MPASMPSQTLDIYTDGGADPNPGPGGWGAVLIYGKHRNELSGAAEDTTNNRMELTAAIEALRTLNRPCSVNLYTDSKYLRDGITKWLPSWRARAWRTADNQPVKNKDLWQALAQLTEKHNIVWQWLRGHQGHPENERADSLATEARYQLVGGHRAPASDDHRPETASQPTTSESMVHLYARGCALGVPGPAGYAATLVSAAGAKRLVSGGWPSATANIMELWGVIAGLRALDRPTRVTIHSGSKYVIDGASKWLPAWERHHWRKKDGSAVKNQEIWQELTHVLGDHDVTWVYLDADRESDPSVEAADEARRQAEEQKRSNR